MIRRSLKYKLAIPANAGIQRLSRCGEISPKQSRSIPAYAGMTAERNAQ